MELFRKEGAAPRAGPLAAGRGVSTDALMRHLVPQRAGDPLGLGIGPGGRPAAPPDPDPYDRAAEDRGFARSLLDAEERRRVDAEIDAGGYLTVEQVRALILENTIKGSVESGGVDPEVMALVDARINYKIFVGGDNIYTREGLYDNFPFHEFNVQPEAVFVQQELGVFASPNHPGGLEYMTRDVGDESVAFVTVGDLVGAEVRKGLRSRRAPARVVKTKIYIGKERWEDFALLQRLFRGAARVATAQIAYDGGRASMPGVFALLGGQRGVAPGRGEALLLEATGDAAGVAMGDATGTATGDAAGVATGDTTADDTTADTTADATGDATADATADATGTAAGNAAGVAAQLAAAEAQLAAAEAQLRAMKKMQDRLEAGLGQIRAMVAAAGRAPLGTS
jgi:hypothetical protein